MALCFDGDKALQARLTSEFGVTVAQARDAINDAWMGLASGDGPLDVPGLVFEQCGDFLWVHEDGTMICTLSFEPGVLPRKVLETQAGTEAEQADRDWDDLCEQMMNEEEMRMRTL